MTRKELINRYLSESERFRIEAVKEEKKLLGLSLLRLLCFLGGSAISLFFFLEQYSGGGLIAAFATAILFLLLLKLYSVHTLKKEFANNLGIINKREAEALQGNLAGLNPGNQYADHDHYFSYDVDLFGDNSLFQYLNRTVTGYGRDLFAGWLSDPCPLSTHLSQRQEIIRELAAKAKWRHEFMAAGMKVPLEKEHIIQLSAWLNEKPYDVNIIHRVMIFLLPAITFGSMIFLIAGSVHYSVLTLMILINLGYVASGLKRTNRLHNAVSGRYRYLSSVKELLEIFGRDRFASEHIEKMRQQVAGDGSSAMVAVKKLGRLIQSFDSRMNLLAGFGLNALFLWDYHCIRRLEKWKVTFRDSFPVWLEILGEMDAYSSFGNYAFNNPGFIYPAISMQGDVFQAEKLGHPLIDEEQRVCNDFTLQKEGNICIITGANMAGKSTFLRTVAVNYILAMAGAPVCAKKLDFTPVKLFTSMRTTDSLTSHESYFYAELKRLRTLKALLGGNEIVLFILDEILKGTNSADKSLGSRLFLKSLIPSGGTGLIATHDISLGELEKEHPGIIFNMCFEIEMEGDTISFDYILRPGITQKMNASLLMRQMGII